MTGQKRLSAPKTFKPFPQPDRPEPEKVQKLFDGLAPKYDRFNRIASLGLDRVWRRKLVRELQRSCPGGLVLDAGCGTGDLIFDLQNENSSGYRYVGVDLSLPMMRVAQGKVKPSSLFIEANCQALPLADESADAVMSAFVLRNVRKIMEPTLREFLRVMKRGSSAFFLDMTVPRSFWLGIPHQIYLSIALPLIGWSLFKEKWSGDYLKETIRKFWSPEEFTQILRSAGFKDASFERLTGGMAVLYRAVK